jgi:prepilin-type N-terminal cleavage/methylation domain-containing protein/prepilin-type processing-associated H-X9-DG protein
MKSTRKQRSAFTLIEMLVVIAIIAVLAALLLPALSRAKASAQRTDCLNNLRQISLGIHLYAEDNGELLPDAPDLHWGSMDTNHFMIFYKRLVKSYVGLHGASSPQDKLFACPADTFYYDWPGLTYEGQSMYDQSNSDYSSYGFNGGNELIFPPPPAFLNEAAYGGLSGLKQTAIKEPVKTVLVFDHSAGLPWSWHQPQKLPAGQCGVNDAKNMVAFVDGHVSYIKIYWNSDFSAYDVTAWCYDPPAGYDYKWHGD